MIDAAAVPGSDRGCEVSASEPTEVGRALAVIAAALPEGAARALLALLRSDLAERPVALLRIRRLGLLAQMVDATGQVPNGEEYETLRAARARVGESWPDRTALARSYGGWIPAVRAAMRLWGIGGARVRSSPLANRRQATVNYSQQEVIAAIILFFERFGTWPGAQEFYDWGNLERRLAYYKGKPCLRIPTDYPVERLWQDEGFDGAVTEAKRRYHTQGAGARAD